MYISPIATGNNRIIGKVAKVISPWPRKPYLKKEPPVIETICYTRCPIPVICTWITTSNPAC